MAVTLDAIASSGGLYRGVAVVEDAVTDAELRRLHDGGIRGIRFNFVKHLGGVPDLQVFYRLVARIKPMGWHIVLHFDAGDLLEQHELLARIDVPFIIDHMGRVKAAEGVGAEALPGAARTCTAAIRWRGSRSAARSACRVGKRPFRDAVPFAQALIAIDAGEIAVGHRLAASEHHARTCRTTASWWTCWREMCPDVAAAQRRSWSITRHACTGEAVMDAPRIGFLGYGEVGQRFAADLRAADAQRALATFDLLLHQAAAGEGMRRHAKAQRVELAGGRGGAGR